MVVLLAALLGKIQNSPCVGLQYSLCFKSLLVVEIQRTEHSFLD